MTFREAFGAVQGMLQNFASEVKEPSVVGHLKRATFRFAQETAATVAPVTIAVTGARDYTLPQVRLGRIWRVEHQLSDRIYPVEASTFDFIDTVDGNRATTGTYAEYFVRFGRTLRVSPQPSSGTITVYHSPIPVLASRDTIRGRSETATGGTSVTVAASTITQGLIANRQGPTDYFNGCKLVFTSGTTLTSQYSYITGANEGSAITFDIHIPVSAAVTTETFEIHDVLEVPDQYAPAVVSYAAGMTAALDRNARVLAEQFLSEFTDALEMARRRPFAHEPGTALRFTDVDEESGLYFG